MRCFIFHKWSEWKDTTFVVYPRFARTIGMSVYDQADGFKIDGQFRYCSVCNKKQTREV